MTSLYAAAATVTMRNPRDVSVARTNTHITLWPGGREAFSRTASSIRGIDFRAPCRSEMTAMGRLTPRSSPMSHAVLAISSTQPHLIENILSTIARDAESARGQLTSILSLVAVPL